MNKSLLILTFSALASLGQPAEAKDVPDAETILRGVRHGSSQNEGLTLDGRLRIRETDQRHPFRMMIERTQITFLFQSEPRHTIVLNLGGDTLRLRERKGEAGELVDVPSENYGLPLWGSGINYLDISLAYLYWPKPKYIKEDVVSERLTWLLQVTNPGKEGPYSKLDVWIDQDTGGLLRMKGYDWQGNFIKKMEVRKVQRVKSGDKKVWALKKMEVWVIDPKTRRTVSRTYMEL